MNTKASAALTLYTQRYSTSLLLSWSYYAHILGYDCITAVEVAKRQLML
jgi:hypothetical protein